MKKNTFTPFIVLGILLIVSCTKEGITPFFYNEYMTGKEQEISQHLQAIGQEGDSFIFITDTHWESNSGYSPNLIKHILDNTSITKVFHGGDFIHGSFTDNYYYANDYMKKMGFTTLYPVFGNHDQYLKKEEDDRGNTFFPSSNSDIYNTFFIHLEEVIDLDGKFYYYLDNESQKIRYFFLDSHWPDEPDIRGCFFNYSRQLSWLEEKCREIGPEWSIIVLQHIVFTDTRFSDDSEIGKEPIVEYAEKSSLGNQLLLKLNDIYDSPDMPTIVAVICGHTHYTYHEYSSKGFPIITSTSDGSWGYRLNDGRWLDDNFCVYRPRNSTDAQSFDVFTIDKRNRKIYATRIGYGENREFTY